MPDNFYSERERLVIDLYKNQNKSIRDIAKIAKMSFRDIGFILKKEGLSHGLAMIDDDNNKRLIPIMKKLPRLTGYSPKEKSLYKWQSN
jgi:hypothetical protein